MKTSTRSIKGALAVLPLVLSIGCAKNVSFGNADAGKTSQSVTPPKSPDEPLTCEPGQVIVAQPMKVLFIVDQSGSNVNGPYEHPGQATDPVKSFRYGVLNEFFQLHGMKTHLSWGFLTFNGVTARGLIYQGTPDSPVFTNDHDVAAQSLVNFQASTDVSNTPVKAALLKARQMIASDMATSVTATQYRIVLITDGYPTDYCPGSPSVVYCPGAIKESEIDSDIQSIMNTAPNAVQMSMVYYGLPDASATARLQRMASLGQGQFVDTNTSSSIHLDDLIQVEVPICK